MTGARARSGMAAAISLALACGGAPARPPPPAAEQDLPAQRLAQARARADAAPGDAALQARAGWLDYLIGSDPAAALARFARAQAAGAPGEALQLALAGRGEILEDRLDGRGAALAWKDALAAAPGGPLAQLCGSRLLDAEGDSEAVDEVVLQAAALLEGGGDPRAARLVREGAARIAASRALRAPDGAAREERAWAAAGVVQRWRVAGPYAPLRLLDLGRALALDGPAPARAPAQGPAGPAGERAFVSPEGDVSLEQEPADGDLFYAASTVTAARGGDYLAWVEGAAALELRLDGAPVVARTPWPREVPRAQTVPVRLPAGPHAVLVRWSRAEGSRFRVALARADGAPSDLTSAAPEALEGFRRPSPCPLGGSCAAPPAWADAGGLRGHAERLLERDPGDVLAAWLLARATFSDDKAAARRAVDRLVTLSAQSAAALTLRAALVLRDPEVPDRLGRARALADLRKATASDPLLLRARLTASALQRDSERHDDAVAALDEAEAAAPKPPPARLLLARARMSEVQGNLADGRRLAAQALAQDPGRCDARQLLFDLARREGGLAEQDRLAPQLLDCPEGRGPHLAWLRDRGRLEQAEELVRRQLALRPASVQRHEQLAELQTARGDVRGAAQTLRLAAALAPRAPEPWRRLAHALELSGDRAGAQAARAEALARAPGDLRLRRLLARDRGERLLAWSDRDGPAIARTPPAQLGLPDGAERPAAVRLLDHGAVEFFADGSAVERSHTVARVLDKKGISRFGEAQVPGDAEVLQVRTLKADGRVLEPESIPEKESLSLPGLEAGDSIEIDYLRAYAPRGSDLKGLSIGAFYFRDEETPMSESTYEVRAPASLDLAVDAHNVQAAPLERGAEGQAFRHTARQVLPRVPEPNQPGESELGPWVQAGWGAGQREVAAQLADWALLRARPSATTDALALAAGGATPRERVERLAAAVSQAVRGRSNGSDFSTPAAHVLQNGRGNRLVALHAALLAAGLPVRVALVRPFAADPAAYRFPRNDLFTAAVLRVELPEGALWIDSGLRLAPVGALPPALRGMEAWLLPLPGQEPELLRTPVEGPAGGEGRSLSFRLKLAASGRASGEGLDELKGFEAGALRDALERLDPDQRRQAVEAMLGRSLRGVSLDGLRTEGESSQGGAARLLYVLRAPLARPDGAVLKLPGSLLTAQLGRRYLQKAERAQPLLIEGTERVDATVELELPEGMAAAALPAPVALRGPFGEYRWSARAEKGVLRVEEALVIERQRVPAARYAEFAAFARAVDRTQEQELVITPSGPVAAQP